jgi:hypothetical protein
MGFLRPGGKQPGRPKDLEAADYRLSVRELRAAPPVRSIPAVVLTSDKCFEFVPGAGGAKATQELPLLRLHYPQKNDLEDVSFYGVPDKHL